jgi:hypothetical protein
MFTEVPKLMPDDGLKNKPKHAALLLALASCV